MDTERLNRAIALRDSGRVEEALRELTDLAEAMQDPFEKASLILNQSTCLTIMGRFGLARALLREAVELSQRAEVRAAAEFGDAVLLWHEGKREAAVGKLDQVLAEYGCVLRLPELRAMYENIQVKRGILLKELARFSEAVPVLEECLSFEIEKKGDIIHCLAICYMRTGEPARAQEKFLEALSIGTQRPYAVSAHYHLGIIYSRQGAGAKALQEFEWCIPHTEEAKISKEHLYGWLAKVSRDLGLKADAQRYDRLAKESATQELNR
jgi:tetratricopeptide (TPR) repeat protein